MELGLDAAVQNVQGFNEEIRTVLSERSNHDVPCVQPHFFPPP